VGIAHQAEASLRPAEQLVHRLVAYRVAVEGVHQRALAEVDRSLIGALIGAALQAQDGRRLLTSHRLEKARQREIDQIAFNHWRPRPPCRSRSRPPQGPPAFRTASSGTPWPRPCGP